MSRFRSTGEFHAAVESLIAELDDSNPEAARLLREGAGRITGLTDGWADFLEAVEEAQRLHGTRMSEGRRARLRDIRDASYWAVYRHAPPPRWLAWLDDLIRAHRRRR